MYKIFKKLFKCVILPLNRCDRGVDLPIPMTINSSSFGLLSVNEAQDLMPLKFKAFLMNKLHPNVHCVVKQHVELKYVPCRGGHFAEMFLCQEHQPCEVEKKNGEVGEHLCNFHHIVFLISSQFSE